MSNGQKDCAARRRHPLTRKGSMYLAARRTSPMLIGALLIVLATPGPGTSQVVRMPGGVVEFIGLERWTVKMIQDTMAVRAPGSPLGDCARVLQQIGFPVASAYYLRAADGSRHIVVTVVEPHRAGAIRLRTPARDSMPDVAEWADGLAVFRTNKAAFQHAVGFYHLHRRQEHALADELRRSEPQNASAIDRYWRFLDGARTDEQFALALRTLSHDRNLRNRVIAASILGAFPERDSAWWALADAMRDSISAVAATAGQALRSASQIESRKVDWRPALPALRALFAGTNVWVGDRLYEPLRRSRIDPALAPELLGGGNARLLIGRAVSLHPSVHEDARGLLVHLAGTDYGRSAAHWQAWADALSCDERCAPAGSEEPSTPSGQPR